MVHGRCSTIMSMKKEVPIRKMRKMRESRTKRTLTSAFRPSSKSELQAAIDDWLSDPAAAEDKYGSHISDWNTEKITDMSELFKGKATFDEDIGRWNTWNVKDMRAMFYGASTFNQNT